MKITKSSAELREYVRTLAGLTPMRADCVIEYTDGIDVDAMIDSRLRQWYIKLLAEGPRELLAEQDLAAGASVSVGGAPASGCTVRLPGSCVRVFELKLSSWQHPVVILGAEALGKVVECQRNPFTRATPESPVAVMAPGGRSVFAWPSDTTVGALSGVSDTDDGTYSMDEAALDRLENFAKTLDY